jgi:hypothetical protein
MIGREGNLYMHDGLVTGQSEPVMERFSVFPLVVANPVAPPVQPSMMLSLWIPS